VLLLLLLLLPARREVEHFDRPLINVVINWISSEANQLQQPAKRDINNTIKRKTTGMRGDALYRYKQ